MTSKSSFLDWFYFEFDPSLDEFVRVGQGILASDCKLYLEKYHSNSNKILHIHLLDTNKDRCLFFSCL